jgi:hypothetical protein
MMADDASEYASPADSLFKAIWTDPKPQLAVTAAAGQGPPAPSRTVARSMCVYAESPGDIDDRVQ